MYQKHILLTGGAGFIGSHVLRRFLRDYPHYLLINLDKLTYAGNLENLADLQDLPNYRFEQVDICDRAALQAVFARYPIDSVIHLAAESHVDRSISGPMDFVYTNVVGTVNLLEAAREAWQNALEDKRFYHVSTDEVYGSLGATGLFEETTPYDPRSPYSASKASSDHFVRAYGHTYALPIVLSNCSNNYGPNQFPEKLIPVCIQNIRDNKPLPIYGDGLYTRDWLWVEDHASAIDTIFHRGQLGETYNIGGHNEWTNLDLVHLLCRLMDEELGRAEGSSKQLIHFVKDRPGHDRRYAIDASKLQRELGWVPSLQFEEGLRLTVRWYLDNPDWLAHIHDGSYRH